MKLTQAIAASAIALLSLGTLSACSTGTAAELTVAEGQKQCIAIQMDAYDRMVEAELVTSFGDRAEAEKFYTEQCKAVIYEGSTLEERKNMIDVIKSTYKDTFNEEYKG